MSPPDTSALIEHASFVRALAFGVLGRDDLTDDALQETYLAALRRPAAPDGRLRAWLGSVGRRRALDLYRGESARRRHEASAPPARSSAAPDVLVERAELGRRMAQAVLALDAPYRDALLLRYYEGLAPREIARRLRLPVETVRTHVKRGIARLRDVLDADGQGRERWLAGIGALVDDPSAGGGPSAVPSREPACESLVTKSALMAVAAASAVVGVIVGLGLLRRRPESDGASTGFVPAMAAVDPSGAALGAPGGGPPLPSSPPVSPAGDSLRPAPKGPPKVAPAEPPFVVAVTANGSAPAAGARVVVLVPGEPTRRVTTDESGRASFELARDATARVFVEAKGMASRTFEYLATAKWRAQPFPVPLESGGAVDGRVVDAKTGAPIAGARILSAGGGSIGTRSNSGGESSYGETLTDGNGRYHLEGLPRDWIVTLSALAPRYGRADTSVIVDRSDGATASELRLEPGGWIRASVKGPDGARVANARVAARLDVSITSLDSRHGGAATGLSSDPSIAESTTGEDGTCELVGLPLGVTIHLRAEATPATTVAELDVEALASDRPDASVTLALRRAARVRLVVTDLDAAALADARVFVDGVDPRVESREGGRIEVGGLDPGRHALVVTLPGRRRASVDVELAEGRTSEESVRLELGATVEGVVKDETGAAMPSRVVYASAPDPARHPSQQGVTDVAGRFRISGLDPDATYALSAADSTATETAPVEVKVPATDVLLTLERRASVRMHARIPKGGAVPEELTRTVVLADGSSEGDGSAWDDGLVEFHFDGGHATLRLAVPGYLPWSKEVDVARGKALDLGEVELDAGLSIEGEVVDPEGRPLAKASVLRAATDHPSSTGEYAVEEFCVPSPCDEAGRFHVGTLPRRPSTLTAWAEGYLPGGATVDPTRPRAAPPRIVLRRGCLVRVELVDANGSAVRASAIVIAPLDARGVPGEPDERSTNGVVHTQRIPAGRWRIRMDEASTDVEVEEGTERSITLHAP